MQNNAERDICDPDLPNFLGNTTQYEPIDDKLFKTRYWIEGQETA